MAEGVFLDRVARMRARLEGFGLDVEVAREVGTALIHDGWAYFGDLEAPVVPLAGNPAIEQAAAAVERASEIAESMTADLPCPCMCWRCTGGPLGPERCQHRGIDCVQAAAS